MKVIQLLGRLSKGGTQQLTLNLCSSLHQKGISVTAVALTNSDISHSDYAFPIRELNINKRNIFSIFKGIIDLRLFLTRSKATIVHVHGVPSLPVVVLAAFGLKCRLYFTWHDSSAVFENKSSFLKFIMRWALSKCSVIFGSSDNVVSRLKAEVPNQKILTFTNGVPYHHYAIKDQTIPIILWTGRIVQEKDPMLLLQAVAKLKKDGYKFFVKILGDATNHGAYYFENLKQYILNYQLSDCIELMGWVDDVQPIINSSQIAVQTSHTEGLSLALLEQGMSGLAIIATPVGDTQKVIIHEKTGLITPVKNSDILYEQLKLLLDNPEKRQQLGKSLHQHCASYFSAMAMRDFLLTFYSK